MNTNHSVRFTIDPDYAGGLSVEMVCPFDKADATRPCWPHDENGVREPQAEGEAVGCEYQPWVEADGIYTFYGEPIVITRQLETARWDNDHFEFRVAPTEPLASGLEEAGAAVNISNDVVPEAGYVLVRGVTSATPVGTPVHFKDALGEFDSVTRSVPWQIGNGEWIVALEGHSGGYGIEFLTVIDSPNYSQGGAS